jgi:hypothetical protein
MSIHILFILFLLNCYISFCSCEPGQQAIYVCCNPKNLLQSISYEHSGDPDVIRQVRRLELALEPDGWRGNVEKKIAREFYRYDEEGKEIEENRSYSSYSKSLSIDSKQNHK